MKKNILYLVAFISVIFAACNPLKDEINNLKPLPTDKTINIKITTLYSSTDAANTGIVAMLNATYPQLSEGSKANVTYGYNTNTVKPADSLYANIQYTVTDEDYSVVNGNNNKNFNATKVLDFLEYKYPQATSPANKLVLLTYTFYVSSSVPAALVTEAYLLQSNGWQKAYLVSPAQYASVGRGISNAFASADVSNLVSYFNTFFKTDPTVAALAKAGDVRYITYKYAQSATLFHQKVYVLTYDGNNWLASTTLSFLKRDGKWVPDPTVYYTLVTGDYTQIADNAPANIGNADNRANLKRYNNFNVVASQATSWTNADVEASLIYILGLKYPNAAVDPTVLHKVKYVAYTGSTGTFEKQFVKTSTGFVIAPPTE